VYLIKELYGSLYCTDASNGDILYELSEPVVLFSLDGLFTLHRIGNKDSVTAYYDKIRERAKGTDLVDDYVLADLPKDVEILNRVYNNSGYLSTLFKGFTLEGLIKEGVDL
jgi:hypothetical protein